MTTVILGGQRCALSAGGDLLKLEYALRCFVETDFPYWTYKLAREYVEGYGLQSGSGIVAESVPMLLEVAEFWCQYYFDQSLNEKFPDGGDRCDCDP